jgi:hypothetical protein
MKYQVNVGINYPPDKRAEAGDVIDASELPTSSVRWLKEQGIITAVAEEKKPATPEPAAGPVSFGGKG